MQQQAAEIRRRRTALHDTHTPAHSHDNDSSTRMHDMRSMQMKHAQMQTDRQTPPAAAHSIRSVCRSSVSGCRSRAAVVLSLQC